MDRFSCYPEPPMPTPRRKRAPKPHQRRALKLIAGSGSPKATPKGILRAHAFAIDDMVELVRAGHASAERAVAIR
jgi:hypothetical protein